MWLRPRGARRQTLFGLDRPHGYPGKLIVVEGIDGSGKSTQLQLLEKWLRARGYPVVLTQWNSSELVRQATKMGKKKGVLTPMSFSLIHATDFADRLLTRILPPLKAGMIVLADRYAYTAFARDTARGVPPGWVRGVYEFSLRPDISLYFRVPIDVSVTRLLVGRSGFKYYEAGMDLKLSPDPVKSFQLFQGRVIDAYEDMIGEFGLIPVDAVRPIPEQQMEVRDIVARALEIPWRP